MYLGRIRLHLFFVFSFLVFFQIGSKAQTWSTDTIHVQINTNDPQYPFPQFLEYNNGKSLAANNAVGVTHADMEKAMREAYQIMMHRALKVPGKVLNGVQYMQYNNSTVPQNYGTFVSEGDGYALLAAAYFADKPTFDGLWAWVHDNRLSKVNKYWDGTPLRMAYTYGAGFAGWECTDADGLGSTNINSAGDGDVDIAMALLIASKQWPTGGITTYNGTVVTYKTEALKMITALVDTLYYSTSPLGAPAGRKGYLSGIVGIDGYIKSGNTWGEVTNWRYSAANTTYPWATAVPDPMTTKSVYVDYNAPAYFEEFAAFLSANGGTPWEISQCKRCAGSGDWTIGQMYGKGYIASAGNYSMNDDGSGISFNSFSAGEDFRCSWRTILNYVWHGNPATTWNPVTHQLTATGNTFEYDMALRHKDFLKFPNSIPGTVGSAFCSKLGASPDPGQPSWRGVAQIKQQYAPNGSVLANYGVNWMVGTGMPAAVASGDLDLTAELYRQCEIEWDDWSGSATVTPADARYINSTPKYFHGWFRTLGMLTASGNLHAPVDMVAAANVKVYMAVDKTFAYEGDIINYQVSYRNYGAADAAGVSITTTIDPNYTVVSASNGGIISGSTITWNIGTITGFKTNALAATMGTRTFVVKVNPIPAAAVACLTSTISASNAPSWTSNEYPNNASYTMERNCVDLLKDRVLAIQKTTDRPVMNSGDIVNFTLNFQNKSGSNLWLNGGRDRVIVSYANYPIATDFYQFYRIWHTAQEAYINLGNYRVSYFMNDAAAIGEYNAATNPTGWAALVTNQVDLDKYGYNPTTYPNNTSIPLNKQLNFTYQKIPWGTDANGAWNQRIITQFADVLTAPSTHIFDKLDSEYLIHKGVVGPGFIRTQLESKPSSTLLPRLIDDWSYSASVQNTDAQGQGQYFFPVTPSYTDATTAPRFAPVTVTNYSKDACGGPVPNFSKVLVEEFDGYTWRRIAGNGPLPGRETYNVTVTDSIPIQLAWNGFTNAVAVGVTATYTALTGNAKFSGYVKWTIPVMLTGDSGKLTYSTIAKTPCAEKTFVNAGWIWSDVDSPDSSAVNLKLTCTKVPPTPPAETSLVKTADKTNVVVGDVVTYTLTYTNKDGSTASWAGTSTLAADWKTLGNGLMPKINGSIISLDQNGTGNPAPGTYGYAFGPNKSYGVNGWIDATIVPTNSSTLSLIYRYQSGTPGQPDFQGLRLEITPNYQGNNNIVFTLYQNTTAIATLNNLAFPGSFNPIKIKTQLVDDKLYIWVNDYTGAPLKVVSGITLLSPGYTGIYGNSQQTLSAFTSHFDAAFNLVLTDPVPAQLNNITAISNSGTLTGSTITWPPVVGPIPANAVTKVTFQATVNSCTDFITNIASASVYGITGIQSQYVLTCGAVTPTCTPPAKVTITTPAARPLILCPGSTQVLKGSATGITAPLNGGYYYTWFKDGVAVSTPSKTYADYTGIVNATTDTSIYTLRVEDGTAGKKACYAEDTVTILILPVLNAGTISAGQTICKGSVPASFTQTVATSGGGSGTYTYQWESSVKPVNPAGIAFASVTTGIGGTTALYTPAALNDSIYYRRKVVSSFKGATCTAYSDTIKIAMVKPLVKGTLTPATQLACYNSLPATATLTTAGFSGGLKPAATAYTYKWQQKINSASVWTTLTPVTPSYTLTTALKDTTQFRVIVSGSCDADTLTAVVNVRGKLLPGTITGGDTICKGADPKDIATKTPAAGAGGTADYAYSWYVSENGGAYTLYAASANTAGLVITGLPNTTNAVYKYDFVRRVTSALCVKDTQTLAIHYEVLPAPDGGTITGSQTLCNGAALTAFTQTPPAGTATYQWESSVNPLLVPFANVTGGTGGATVLYTPGTIIDSIYYRRKAAFTSGAATCPAYSDTIKVSVITPLVKGIISPAVQTACYNTAPPTATFTTSGFSGGLKSAAATYTYKWQQKAKNATVWTTLSGTTASYTTSVLITDTTAFRVIVSGFCDSDTLVAMVNVGGALIPGKLYRDTTVCKGGTVTLTSRVDPTGGRTGSAYSYVWKQSLSKTGPYTTSASSANTKGLTITNVVDTTYYYREVSDPSCGAASAQSDTIKVSVYNIKSGTTGFASGKLDTTICAGGNIAIKGLTSPTGGKKPYTYSWQMSASSPTTGFVAASGSVLTDTFYTWTNSTLGAGTYYFRRITTDASGCTLTAGNVDTVKVGNGLFQNVLPTDTLHTVCYNSAVPAMSALAPTGGTGSGAIMYQWFVKNGNTYTAIAAATNLGYTPGYNVTQDTFYVRRAAHGSTKCDTATLRVHIQVYKQVKGGNLKKLSKVCPLSTVILTDSVSASGGSGAFTYSWQISRDGGTTFTAIAGSGASNSYTLTGSDLMNLSFRRLATNSTCSPANVSSDTIVLPVVHISVSLNEPGSTCLSSTVPLQYTATVTDGNSNAGSGTYSWYVNNQLESSSTTNTYSYSPTSKGVDSVKVVFTSDNNCTATAKDTVNITDAKDANITITGNTTLCAGFPANFSIMSQDAQGQNPSYAWYVNTGTTPVASGTTYSSSTLQDGDQVYVKMTSDYGCLLHPANNPYASNTLKMTIKSKPTPVVTPDTVVICSAEGGAKFTVSGTASGSTLQWNHNDVAIPNQHGTSYYATQAGTYSLSEDNGYCSNTSPSSVLTIIPSPLANAGLDMYVQQGTFVQLQATGGTTGTTYEWTPPTGLNSTTISNPSFKAENTITYIVELTNTDPVSGKTCTSEAPVTVTVVQPIVIPNVITVNGDGNNDTWNILHIEGYPNATFEIYNRWGNLVWKSTGYPKQWDGTNFRNGEVLPDGTYFYIINLHSQIYTEPYTGWIQIVK